MNLKLPQCEINFSEENFAQEILLVGGGRFPNENYFLQLAEGRRIFCIDRGIELCKKLKILPEILIGDFDSAGKIFVDWAAENKIKIIRHPVEKDFTDTQLALKFFDENFKNFSAILTGSFGGRADHLFSTIFSCANFSEKIFLADDREIIFYIHGGETATINFLKKPVAISLLPMKNFCDGVTTKNLHWELENAKLFQNLPNAVSNRAESSEIKISISTGTLAIYFCFEELNIF